MSDGKNMIFGNGIEFVGGLDRGGTGNTPEVSDQEFSEAVEMLVPQVAQVSSTLDLLDDNFKMPSAVINVEIKSKYLPAF